MSIEKTVTVFNPTTWHTNIQLSGAAEEPTGVDPDLQIRIVNGGEAGPDGAITYPNFPISTPTLESFEFNLELYWQTDPLVTNPGDYYSIRFGSGSTNPIDVVFVFWTGYSNNGFSGSGIYLLKNNVAVAKSALSPGAGGAGQNQWYPITIKYNKSVLNTWTIITNGVTVMTYSDANALSWQQLPNNDQVSVMAHSGVSLRMRVWIRKLNAFYKAILPIQTYNTALMPVHFYPASSDSTFSSGRAAYNRVFYPRIGGGGSETNTISAAEITKRNFVYNRRDASSRVERLKLQAIGKSSMRLKETDELRFKAPNVNDVRDAVRRSRSRGYMVHPPLVPIRIAPTPPPAPEPEPEPPAPEPEPPAPGGDLIVLSLTTSLSAYEESSVGDWVSITAAEWATLKTNVSGTVTAGASDTMMTTNTNLGSGFSNNPVSAIVTNLVELPRSSKVPANSYIYGFSVRFGSDLGTSFGVFANTSTSSNTGFNQLGNLISSMINGTNYFVLKGVSATNGSTDGLLGFFTGTKLDYEGASFKGSAARIRFIGDNNTENPLIRWNFFSDSTIPDSSTVLAGSLNNYGTFCIQALATPTKQWD